MEPPLQPRNDIGNRSSFCPFSLRMTHMDCMINMEFVNHPIYAGLEIQRHDDEIAGTGLLVFLQRKLNNITDVYYESTFHNPSSLKKFFSLGKGLGVWKKQQFVFATLDVSAETGVQANVMFRDIDGRLVHVQMNDDTPFDPNQRSGMTHGFLSPIGAAIDKPSCLQLIYMKQFDLVRRAGTVPIIEIDGRSVSTGHVPFERCLWGTRLIKVAKDLIVVQVNPKTRKINDETHHGHSQSIVHRDNQGHVQGISAESHGHCATFFLDRPFPDSVHFDEKREGGSWRVDIDGDRIVSGTWEYDAVSNSTENTTEAKIQLEVTRGWRPNGLSWMIKMMFPIVPILKDWPETYRWVSYVQWNRGETNPAMVSHWERTSGDYGSSLLEAVEKSSDCAGEHLRHASQKSMSSIIFMLMRLQRNRGSHYLSE
ncbi:hypothetical protein IV203_018822 [Nitzschia inconspicua]|uniref:Uncharacterized protein n=1 Tax=Nitzschia inconspicua TaxID=303405 RepID=A0A9K3M233_9STRA|nr:hypothetical protein IV203_018822 [Nitzschia inconspicua]